MSKPNTNNFSESFFQEYSIESYRSLCFHFLVLRLAETANKNDIASLRVSGC